MYFIFVGLSLFALCCDRKAYKCALGILQLYPEHADFYDKDKWSGLLPLQVVLRDTFVLRGGDCAKTVFYLLEGLVVGTEITCPKVFFKTFTRIMQRWRPMEINLWTEFIVKHWQLILSISEIPQYRHQLVKMVEQILDAITKRLQGVVTTDLRNLQGLPFQPSDYFFDEEMVEGTLSKADDQQIDITPLEHFLHELSKILGVLLCPAVHEERVEPCHSPK